MKITFNSLGQVVGAIDFEGQTIRQGMTNVVLKAVFEGKQNINYNAKFNLTRSDSANITNVVMNLGSASNSYEYPLNDEWFFAKSGQTTVTFFLVDGNGDQVATGQVQFTVQANDYDEEPETITEAQYNALLAVVSKKVGFKTKTVRVSELPEVGEEDTVYFLGYSDRNLVEAYIYDVANGEYQYLGSNSIDLGNYYERADGEEFEREVDSRVTSVESELSALANGSPKGVYATLTDLQSAYPTGDDNIYLVSSNGHWYYWNGSAWTDGGSYLSPISYDNLDLAAKVVELENGNIVATANLLTYVDSTSRSRTKSDSPIFLRKGSKITLSDYTTYRVYVIRIKDDGQFDLIAWKTSDFTITTDGYYVLLVDGGTQEGQKTALKIYPVSIANDIANRFNERDQLKYDLYTGYISDTGVIVGATSSQEVYTNFIKAGINKKIICSQMFSSVQIKWSAIALYDKDFNFISRLSFEATYEGTGCLSYMLIPNSAYYFRLMYRSFGNTNAVKFYITDVENDYSNFIPTVLKRISDLERIPTYLELEEGNIVFTENNIVYESSESRVRTKVGGYIYLPAKSIITLKDFTKGSFYVGKINDDGTISSEGWKASDFVIQNDGKYVLLIKSENSATQSELKNLLIVYEASPYISTSNRFKEQNLIRINETYPGYINSFGDFNPQDDTQKEIYTGFIRVGLEKVLYTIGKQIDSSTNLWVAIAYYDENFNFIERVTLISGTTQMFVPTVIPSGVKYFRLTYRTYGQLDIIKFYIDNCKNEYYQDIVNIFERKYSNSNVKTINHRGYNSIAPENTLPAFKLSKEKGFDYVETDVRFTSDNIAVCLHDETVNRTSNGTGNISDMTYDEARLLDFGGWKSSDYAGTRIPSFEEFLTLCKKLGLKCYVEIKAGSNDQITGLYNLVVRHGMLEHVTWICNDSSKLNAIKTLDSKARLGLIVASINDTNISTAASLKTTENEVFIDTDSLDTSYIESLITNGLKLEVWGSLSESQYISMDDYVTGYTTNQIDVGRLLINKNL